MNDRRTRAAELLRKHYDTEATDAGLRSLNLVSTGASASHSYDAAAVARAGRQIYGETTNHARVLKSLRMLPQIHQAVLALAYGVRLRDRDVEDGKRRKALRQTERNWRVRLAELYGATAASTLASPIANKLFAEHVGELREAVGVADARMVQPMLNKAIDGGLISWLLGPGQAHRKEIAADANRLLFAALDGFADAWGVTRDKRRRTRNNEPARARILAIHHEHGYEIG